MKKLAILFLLTTVLVGGIFAQTSVKANFELNNVSEGNNGKMDPKLALIFNAAGSQEVGPGSLNFGLQISPQLHFGENENPAVLLDGDDNYGLIGYSLAAGPGTLGINLKLLSGGVGLTWRPEVSYNGIAAGPAVIGVGAYYDFKTSGVDGADGGKPFGKDNIGGKEGDNDDDVAVYITAAFGFGLNVKYEFKYGLGLEEIKNIAYLDINYAVMAPLVVGVELDKTGRHDLNATDDIFKGILIKPYVTYTLNENMSASLYIKLDNVIGNEDVAEDIMIHPGVWFQYSL